MNNLNGVHGKKTVTSTILYMKMLSVSLITMI